MKRIPLLFVGKTTLEDLHILADLQDEGIITPPKYIPPQFRDIAALSAWMVYSLFLNCLDLRRLAVDFRNFAVEFIESNALDSQTTLLWATTLQWHPETLLLNRGFFFSSL